MHTVRVWDLPTRVFHWLLALSVVGMVITAKLGGNWMVWHLRLGHVVLALLLFRLAWGLFGGHWTRFTSFIYSPAAVLRYLRGQAPGRDHAVQRAGAALAQQRFHHVVAQAIARGERVHRPSSSRSAR